MGLFNWHKRDTRYNAANYYFYGVMSSEVISDLVTSKTRAIYIDFQIRSEMESASSVRNSDYRDNEFNFYYDLVISNQDTEYMTRLFSRHYSEHGTSGLFGDFKCELEELDEPKVIQGLNDYFGPLLKYLSAKNGLENGDSVLNDLFKTICSVRPVLNNEDPNRVCYKRRVTLIFLDAVTAKAQMSNEREKALFEGPIKWLTFRFHFKYGKCPALTNRAKLALTIINSMGESIEYDIFDFRCDIENKNIWNGHWVAFVNTEGKIRITKLLSRLSGYHECVSGLVELKSIDIIINNVIGRYDFEIPFNFSRDSGSDSENKTRKKRTNKTQNDSIPFWLGLLGLETMPDTMGELKQAYHNACFAFHPDRFSDEGKKKWAEEQLKKISDAFDNLSRLYT